jgi:Family of unknown function (DUF5996)
VKEPLRELPALPLAQWEPTKETLHLWTQIVGKVRLATAPPRNHWWQVTLYVEPRGLTTRCLPSDRGEFEITFDFVAHELVVRTSRGQVDSFPLADGLSVAAFYERFFALLDGLGIEVEIKAKPYGLASAIPFADDTEHAAYDCEAVERFWLALRWTDGALQQFTGWFGGKTSPVHFFWHGFDLAVTRFSGRRAPEMPNADPVTREAYSHEVISFGFWPGDDKIGMPAFYSYTAPEPANLTDERLRPGAASWHPTGSSHLALLPYDTVREAPDPRATLLDFLQSAYEAGTRAAGWDAAELRSSWAPDGGRLSTLAGS